jgi:hypothetical protein
VTDRGLRNIAGATDSFVMPAPRAVSNVAGATDTIAHGETAHGRGSAEDPNVPVSDDEELHATDDQETVEKRENNSEPGGPTERGTTESEASPSNAVTLTPAEARWEALPLDVSDGTSGSDHEST